jgi:hypothetical protein
MSCAMKALSTSETANFVETLRQSCGGHGYMGIQMLIEILKAFRFHQSNFPSE